jgi:hypothetical protein
MMGCQSLRTFIGSSLEQIIFVNMIILLLESYFLVRERRDLQIVIENAIGII